MAASFRDVFGHCNFDFIRLFMPLGEIDRCLKKVAEGVETFEDIWQKVLKCVQSVFVSVPRH